MKKMKVLITLVGALCVLAFAAKSSAEIYTVSDEDIDEFLAKLAAEDLDDDMLDSQFEGMSGSGYGLDSCYDCRPACYAVSFEHNGVWTVLSGADIYWDSETQSYAVIYDGDVMSDVDGVRQSWKTTSSAMLTCCSYCDSGTFEEGYYYQYGYIQGYFQTDSRSCWIDAGNSYITVYMAQETSFYNNFDFALPGVYKIGLMDSPTPSYVGVGSDPE